MDGAIATLQIDTRAKGEVRRLSGGNQQKVTIARWVAGGVQTMLCFDPTRGIDIRTKHQIYMLLRDLANAGAAVLFYTSELKEVQLVCDRAIVIFGGRVVAEIDAADADEAALLRAAYNLRSDAMMPEHIVAGAAAAEAAEDMTGGSRQVPGQSRPRPRATDERSDRPGRGPHPSARTVLVSAVRRNGWTLGLLGFLVILLVFTKLIQPTYGVTGVRGLAISVLPLALAAVAQAIVVIAGGIDLSIGSMMALTSVVAASQMKGQSEEFGVAVVLGVLVLGIALGAVNGGLVVLTRVPDIVVTLAMSFVWAGCALLVLKTPGGGSAVWLKDLFKGSARQRVDPQGGGRLGHRRGRHLDPRSALQARSVPLCDREQPAGGVPERRVRRPDEDPGLCPDGPVRGAGRPEPRREHRDRHAGPGWVHPPERRRGRPRRASASPAAGAACSARSWGSSSSS